MNVNREMNNEKSIDGLTMKGMMNDCWQDDEHDGCNKCEAVKPRKMQSSVTVLENGQQKWGSEHAEQFE